MPKPTAQVEPFHEVLGPELTVVFLLKFGGSEVFFSANPQGHSEAEKLIGPERIRALVANPKLEPRMRIPLANRWLAKMLHWQGHSTLHIARTLRASSVSVRSWLKDQAG
jgi:hypothetical protein